MPPAPGPPWVLRCPVLTETLPQTPTVEITVRQSPPITVRYPPTRVPRHRPPARPPAEIELPLPPTARGWQRLGVVRIWSPPPRRRGGPAQRE